MDFTIVTSASGQVGVFTGTLSRLLEVETPGRCSLWQLTLKTMSGDTWLIEGVCLKTDSPLSARTATYTGDMSPFRVTRWLEQIRSTGCQED